MAAEYTASTINWVSTVLVNHPRLGRVRMNAADWIDKATSGPILEGPTTPTPSLSVPDEPLKDPRLDGEGRVIADQSSASGVR
jgi:hypothetical protein